MPITELYAKLEEGGKNEVEDIVRQINHAFIACSVFILIAIFTPLVAFYFNPLGENIDVWFQRSGAITVVFGLLADIQAARLKHLSFSNSRPFLYGPIYVKRKYSACAIWVNGVALIVVITGTVIWGYGDLLCTLLC